jgi:alkylhydroperoxidase family enzyme
MTKNLRVDDALMQRLRADLGDTALVELVTVIAAYNCVSRTLLALNVTPEE